MYSTFSTKWDFDKMGILTVFKKQAFAFENGISIKWESGPPHPAFCSKWESRLLFYNKNNEKQQGCAHKLLQSVHFP